MQRPFVRRLLVLLTALAVLGACSPSDDGASGPDVYSRAVYVNPTTGADTNKGTESRPFRTIQAALDDATPGTLINLAAGTYRERITTKMAGKPDAPITLKGPESGKDRSDRYRATVVDKSRVVNINHSHYVLEGFTVDGQEQLLGTDYPTDLRKINEFKRRVRDKVTDSRLIYVGSSDTSRGVTGVTIRDMFLSGGGGECVRLRNDAHDNTITDSVIQYCGMYGKKVGKSDSEFHNGEGIYIGSSPGSTDQPMHANDTGSGNVIKDNVIRTFGTECLDVKENAHHNVFDDNTCSDNAETTKDGGSNIELRGYDNVVRNNRISDSLGYGVKIRSDKEAYDKGGNVVEDNRISNTAGKPIFIRSDAKQGRISNND